MIDRIGPRDHLNSLIYGRFYMIAGLCVVLSGAAVLFYQCYFWLRHGFWTPFELRSILQWIGAKGWTLGDWYGVQKIISFVFGFPLSASLVVIGWIMVLGGNEEVRKAEAIRAEYLLRKRNIENMLID